ncbi:MULTISPECIES: hypothetical protein [unclassified Phaeobacter]|uniref:hypothetical protein n=1 Tax=unclassified Phaeobacter TaxID=2621772 RepID=UPI003A86DE3A
MQKSEHSSEDILPGLPFWVEEASAARKAAAYVRCYVEVQTGYLEEKEKSGGTLSDPHNNPVARVAYGRLYTTWRELVLFSCRAIHDKSGYGLRGIKNDLYKLCSSDVSNGIASLKIEFKDFDRHNRERLDEIVCLRKKAVAHSDLETIFREMETNTKVSDVVELAEAVVSLLEKMCSAYLTTRSLSFEEARSLIIHHEVHAAHDARKFWEHNFSLWAK